MSNKPSQAKAAKCIKSTENNNWFSALKEFSQTPFPPQKKHPNGCFFCGGGGEIRSHYYRSATRTRASKQSPGLFLLLRNTPFSNLFQKNNRVHESVPYHFGGGGEIRTLEPLLTVTRFPIVRARPATRLLHAVVRKTGLEPVQ